MRRLVPVLLSALLGLPQLAFAGLFEPTRSRDPLPAREVERSIVLPMGWSEVQPSYGSMRSGTMAQRDASLDLGHGLTRRVEGWLRLNHRDYRVDGRRASGFAEPSFGLRGILAQRDIGGSWLAWDVGYRAAFGETYLPGGPAISDPTARTWIGLVGRQRIGGMRAELGGRLGAEMPGPWGTGPTGCGSVGRAGPGLVGAGWLDTVLQAGPLLVRGRVESEHWTARQFGVSEAARCLSPTPGEPIRDRSGHAIDAGPGGGIQLSRGLGVHLDALFPVSRENQAWRPVHHARGPWVRGRLQVAF